MSLPEATPDDLRRIGITPEVIRDQIQLGGRRVDGDIVSVQVFVPTDVAHC